MLDESGAAFGRRVAAVHEAVDKHVLHALLLGHFEQRVEMREQGMHAAVAAQAHQMQAMRLGVLHGSQQHRIVEELARGDHASMRVTSM